MFLVTSATGKTGSRIVNQLAKAGHRVRALSRRGLTERHKFVEPMAGNMDDPSVLEKALEGVDAVLHIGPTVHPRETAIGQSIIDIAKRIGTKKFVYMSVIHSQIEDLVNHKAKREVESHLMHTRMDWTILQPQHYYQNINVKQAVEDSRLDLAYSAEQKLNFADLDDVVEVAVKVLTEDGHRWACYELASDEHLSTNDLCKIMEETSGKAVEAVEFPVKEMISKYANYIGPASFDDRSAASMHRIFTYYDLYGCVGNGNVMRWLLGRPGGTFKDYCIRSLTE